MKKDVIMKITKTPAGFTIGIVIGFLLATLLENPLLILGGILLGSILDISITKWREAKSNKKL